VKPPAAIIRQLEGSLMVMALLVVVVGAIILSGWAQLLATRARFADAADDGQARRVTLENARAYARQYILTNMPSGTVPGLTNSSFPTPWGTGTITISNSVPLWTSAYRMPDSTSTNFNPFSPMERLGFYVTIHASLTDGTNSYPWTFLVRSRSPIAAGYGYVLHNTNATYSATNLPANYIDFRSGTNGTNFVGTSTNMPQVPLTSATASSTSSYNGSFQLPASTIVTADTSFVYPSSTNNYGVITNTLTTNSIEIVIDTTSTNPILRYTVPDTITNRTLTNGTNRYTNLTHRVVTARIQSSANTNTFHIIATNGNNLTNLVLCGLTNTRKIYFYRSASANLTLSTTNTADATWNLGMTMSSNSPLSISYNASHTLTIIGGIRASAPITKVGTGSWTISQDPSPGTLDDVGDRIMWLEDYPTPQ